MSPPRRRPSTLLPRPCDPRGLLLGLGALCLAVTSSQYNNFAQAEAPLSLLTTSASANDITQADHISEPVRNAPIGAPTQIPSAATSPSQTAALASSSAAPASPPTGPSSLTNGGLGTSNNAVTSPTANDPQQQHSHLSGPSPPTGKYVKLGRNQPSANLRSLDYGAAAAAVATTGGRYTQRGHLLVSTINNKGNHTSEQSASSRGGSSDNPETQLNSQKRGKFDKICIGTSNRMSGQHNKTDHYQNLADRYRNCTYVIGNLEITWLDKDVDLTFLESIREITGYLLIAYVDVERIRMPNLQIIRGRDLFKLNNGQKEEFAMFLIENELRALELPNLREILAGSIGSYNNRNLCHIRTITWDEILNWPYKSVFVYNGTEPECPPCDASCAGSCWGEGPEMCQRFSKTSCSPQCSQGRCFGSAPRECCHLFCAGGCTGPKQTDCLACKNFYDDGECIQECPSMQRYNPSKFLWEPNPNGKYAFGATCVKECPEHLLRDNGACVRTCPPNKRSHNGECIPCGGPCPKNCQGVDVVHSGNIDQLVNCTVIEGSITILDSSFTGYAELTSTHTIGTRYRPMHPSRLEVFKTLREITGYLNIQANHTDFRNLSYFRNLQTIGGRQTTDLFHALTIFKTSLVSLNLRSLRKVRSGGISIEENKDLCFADTIDWSQINVTKRENIIIRNNADIDRCKLKRFQCHKQCARDGCWGPGPDECLSCNYYKLDDYCVDNCTSTHPQVGLLSFDAGNKTCKKCHSECKVGCYGPEARQCRQCQNIKDGPYCVAECPNHKFNNDGICEECDKGCVDGCTGPSNRPGDGGCNLCGKAVINSTNPLVAYCLKADEPCPEGYYQEYLGPGIEGTLKAFSGKPVCRRCHHKCKSCIGMGTHISVCECAKYISGEQCEDYCPRDTYADESSRQCNRCSPECNGCFGPTEADCQACRVYRIYSEPYLPVESQQLTVAAGVTRSKVGVSARPPPRFNCTAQCPPNKPHRISDSNMLDPYCSEDPGNDQEGQFLSWQSIGLFIIFSLCAVVGCVLVYRCQVEKDKTVKLTMRLSGFDDVEPLNQSNVKPNLAPLRSIKETELRRGNVLGSGFGGTVYQGFWYPKGQEHKEPRPVAIKVLRDNGQSNMNKEFLEEAYIMASVNHPNLVRLLAVCMTSTQLMLVTQLMPLGCLLDYVQKHKNDIGSKNLLEWCKQIAKGMAYLEDRRMVHRDLALRNVLLQRSGRALISDFGLAKLLEVDQSEYHSGGGRLPIKWLAPECIRERKFTHKSDVWAFGVTIWELLTFGKKPFEEYETKDVPLAIDEGARLQQPGHMSAEVYKVMYACWFPNPENRPNFKTIADNFVNFARDPERYLSLGAKGIDYSTREELVRDPGATEDYCVFDDYDNGLIDYPTETGENDQPSSVLPDLISSTLAPGSGNPLSGEMFPGFELRHHSDSSENNIANGNGNNQLISRPTFKKAIGMIYGNSNQRNLIEENMFGVTNLTENANPNFNGSSGHISKASSATPPSDSNNNFLMPGANRLTNEARWPTRHTMSTASLGQGSEQPTDLDDYLLPSPSSNEDKFNKFLASRESKAGRSKVSPVPPYARDPPHSAGLIGISNDEYFLTRVNYADASGSHNAPKASSGQIPQSLV